jgi:hypothetical protein
VDDWAAAGGWNAGGSWETAGFNWVSEPAPAPKHENKSREATKKSTPAKQETKPVAQKKPQSQSRDSGSTRETSMPATQVDAPAAYNPPISVFQPLVHILREADKNTMMRSQLGEQLAKRKGLYLSAGALGFSDFISLAAKKNIVTLHGIDNHQQVKLKQKK